LKPKFNNLSGDYEFMQGKNITTNQSGYSDPVNGKAGDEIQVALYYHNTVPGSVAENTRVRVQLPTGYNTSNVLTATLSADNADTVTGTVVNGVETGRPNFTILSTAATKVSLVAGSVKWYPEAIEATPTNNVTLPGGQNGNNLVTSGLNIGDIEGCYQHSGFIVFRVKLEGQTIPQASLQLTKEVRRAGSTEAFRAENQVNPGENVEYRITVRNIDGQGIATNVKLIDTLEQGLTYIPGTTKKTVNGTTTALPDGITTAAGIVVAESMAPLSSVIVTFQAKTDATLANAVCRRNIVRVTASNATLPGDATANTCFVVPTPTPSPTPTPTSTPTATPVPTPPVATPKPVLPETGGDVATLASVLGLSLAAGGVTARQLLSRRALKKQARNVTIV
jgi:uncharacterized repeat protein (TIGR01451 family)